MMKDAIGCLSVDVLERLTHDEIPPGELGDIEHHVTDCERCRQLFDGVMQDPQWSEEIRPVLQETAVATSTDAEFDDRASNASILSLLGPTDDPHMLGRIGVYEVVGIIGQGGMGVVFKAFDAALDRFVAIKMLLPHLAANGAARKRFSREAQAVAAVVDDHVLPIYGVDEWQETPYIVMQYSRGTTLQKRIEQQGPLELKEVLRVALQTARGLAAAHAQGLVHRDVKPANILLDGTVERAVLTDFGLARAADDASITRTGIVSGTPQYMSPEQVRGESVDARSDLFSLGSTMYAMCTGRSPFRSDTPFGVMHRLTHDEPTSICEINPDIPVWLAGIVERLLSKEPQNRLESANQVANLLEECLAHVQQPTSVQLPKLCDSLRRQTATDPERRGPFFRSPVFTWIAALAFFFVFGTVMVLELNKGTLRIESELDDVAVRVMQGENVVKELTVSRAGTAVRIAAGKYVIEIEGQTDDITIKGGTITLARGATKVASIVQLADANNPAVDGDSGLSVRIGAPPETPTGKVAELLESLSDQSVSEVQFDPPTKSTLGSPSPTKRDFTSMSHGRFAAVVEKSLTTQMDGVGGVKSEFLYMRAFIGESLVGMVRVGNPVTIKIDALPTTICSGQVTAVIRVADPPMRNGMPGLPFVAIIAFNTMPNLLKAGMTGEVDIEAPANHDETRSSSSATKPKANADDLGSSGIKVEVDLYSGDIILRGNRVDVERAAKDLSDDLDKKTNRSDESKQEPDHES